MNRYVKPGSIFGRGFPASSFLPGPNRRTNQCTRVHHGFGAANERIPKDILGQDPRLQLVQEDGLSFLRREPAESYDFVFADVMMTSYYESGWNSLQEIMA